MSTRKKKLWEKKTHSVIFLEANLFLQICSFFSFSFFTRPVCYGMITNVYDIRNGDGKKESKDSFFYLCERKIWNWKLTWIRHEIKRRSTSTFISSKMYVDYLCWKKGTKQNITALDVFSVRKKKREKKCQENFPHSISLKEMYQKKSRNVKSILIPGSRRKKNMLTIFHIFSVD